ncbi:unnamed protein product [Litomosoides sigmodontis]|uniref:Tubulin beta chain n=1 Tax=Litomosoides sigmodontis TaxID=42156 RepID=A0A3P7JM08_LITSI|nr:unnamed protein product [Litomosoides sigmodontis]
MQLGRCGNNVGTKFFETICKEHNIEPSGTCSDASDLQLEHIGVYFYEAEERKYFPRAVVVDFESEIPRSVLQSTHPALFREDNFVLGRASAGNNWARGFYGGGEMYVDEVLDVVRKEAEICDRLQGFDISHALGGGVGSGFGSLIVEKIKEQYPNRCLSTYSVFPAHNELGNVAQWYNTTLSIPKLAENVDVTYCVDNAALHRICKETMKIAVPAEENLNDLTSMTMAEITSILRFPGQMNSDLAKFIGIMVPFPKLHFLASSFASLPICNTIIPAAKVKRLIEQMFHPHDMISGCNPVYGRYFSVISMFRGNVSMEELKNQITGVRSSLIPGLQPHDIKMNITKLAASGTSVSGALVGNTTAIKEVFAKVGKQFETMFRRKAFLHWYIQEGMDEADFIEAENYMNNMIAEYGNYE